MSNNSPGTGPTQAREIADGEIRDVCDPGPRPGEDKNGPGKRFFRVDTDDGFDKRGISNRFRNKHDRATMANIRHTAKQASVSITTVSRVLHKLPGVSEAACDTVIALALPPTLSTVGDSHHAAVRRPGKPRCRVHQSSHLPNKL